MACACDVTPASLSHVVRVLYAPVFVDERVSDLCTRVLSVDELRQSERKTAIEHRAEFVQRRAFRRYCAATAMGGQRPFAKFVFGKTSKGRPFLRDVPGLCFSFSSCRLGMLGAWAPTHAIGVDIEDQTGKLDALALARQFFSIEETATVERLGRTARRRVFYRLWCIKEAALKSIGEGLPFGLNTFKVELHPLPRFAGTPTEHGRPGHYQIHEIADNGITAALVVRDRKPGLQTRAMDHGLSAPNAMVATSDK